VSSNLTEKNLSLTMAKDSGGKTPLDLAKEGNHQDIVKLLKSAK
jgi:hypothetical protein